MAMSHCRRGDRPARVSNPIFEPLESRQLLFAWTPQEVYLSELVNRARSDPLSEGVRLGLDFTASLTAAEIARLVPSEPLALSPQLTVAARAHSLDMANRDFFDHVNPDGLNPTQRVQAAGYAGTAGENIAAGYTSIDAVHRAWLESVGHRKNVLSLHSNFTSTFHYDEFGPGFAFTSIGPFYDYYTEDLGVQSGTPDLFVLGAVFDDANADNFYTVGEGLAGVRIDVARTTDPAAVVNSYTTDAAGNYQMSVGPGSFILTLTNLASGLITRRNVTVSNVNVRVVVEGSQITDPPGGGGTTDDHANSGDLAHATVVFIDPASGDGISAGAINPASDTDLFRFTAAGTGSLTITVTTPDTLSAGLRVFGSAGNALGLGTPAGDGTDATFQVSVVQGQTYFIQIESADGAATGDFVLSINGPESPSGGGSGGGGGTTPPSDILIARPGAGIYGSGLDNGRLTLTTVNNSGRPVVFQQAGATNGVWTARDLLTAAGGVSDAADPNTWTDPKDHLTYAVARSAYGLLLFKNSSIGSWSFRNLTAEIAGAQLLVGSITVFTTTDRLVCVGGLNAAGEVVLYTQTGTLGASGYNWTFINISARDLAPQGIATPTFVGPLISYVTAWNGLTIAGLDSAGHMRAVWFAPGLPRWTSTDLTISSGAPALTGGLTVYLTWWGGIDLAGIDSDGKLSVAWWVPGFGGEWRLDNLTDNAGGPLLNPGSVASFSTWWGGLNVVGVDLAGRLVVYWWTPDVVNVFGEDRWHATSLADSVAGPAPVLAGRLAGVSVGDTIDIAGITSAGSVCRYWWRIGDGAAWHAENISDIAMPL